VRIYTYTQVPYFREVESNFPSVICRYLIIVLGKKSPRTSVLKTKGCTHRADKDHVTEQSVSYSQMRLKADGESTQLDVQTCRRAMGSILVVPPAKCIQFQLHALFCHDTLKLCPKHLGDLVIIVT
jgi:hypothetical protein